MRCSFSPRSTLKSEALSDPTTAFPHHESSSLVWAAVWVQRCCYRPGRLHPGHSLPPKGMQLHETPSHSTSLTSCVTSARSVKSSRKNVKVRCSLWEIKTEVKEFEMKQWRRTHSSIMMQGWNEASCWAGWAMKTRSISAKAPALISSIFPPNASSAGVPRTVIYTGNKE